MQTKLSRETVGARAPLSKSFVSPRHALGAALVLLSFAAPAVAQLPRHGRMLPDVPIQMGGASLSLKQYRGKALVIGLISTTCVHCLDAMKGLKEIQTKYAAAGLQVVVAAGDPGAATSVGMYAAQQKANFPVGYLDQAAFMKLADIKPGVRPFVPIVMFVDRTGMVRAQFFGDADIMKKDAATFIRLTAEQLMKDHVVPAKAAPASTAAAKASADQ